MTTLDNVALSLSFGATLNKPSDLNVNAAAALAYSKAYQFATGVGAGQADQLVADQRTINASSNDDVDLAGSLINAVGDTVTFARIKGLIVEHVSGTNTLIMGGGASNPVTTILGGTTPTLTIRPGGLLVLLSPSETTGYLVTAATADILRFTNGGAGSSVVYNLIVIGATA
jgi:hypothetical protein